MGGLFAIKLLNNIKIWIEWFDSISCGPSLSPSLSSCIFLFFVFAITYKKYTQKVIFHNSFYRYKHKKHHGLSSQGISLIECPKDSGVWGRDIIQLLTSWLLHVQRKNIVSLFRIWLNEVFLKLHCCDQYTSKVTYFQSFWCLFKVPYLYRQSYLWTGYPWLRTSFLIIMVTELGNLVMSVSLW